MAEAYVTPALIRWARERSAETTDEAAHRVGVKPEKFVAWESGQAHPTLRQAESIAQKFYIPFGYLFLSSPPTSHSALPDLRTVEGLPNSNPSPEFEEVLNDALRKQEWYKSYLEEEGAETLQFIGRFSVNTPLEIVANDIHNTLAISQEARPQSANWEDFLQTLMRKAEQVGVLVLRNSVVGNNTHRHLRVEEFRGFVISDELAPLIFLNGSDAKSAQIFTLIHELTHLWIGQSGISNLDYRSRPEEQTNPIERFCDGVTAQALVPELEFLSGWTANLPIVRNLTNLIRYFKVSQVVILRRAYALGKITNHEFQDYYFNRIRGNGSPSRGGGDFNRNVLVRNSHTFSTVIVDAVLSGRTSEMEAARLLDLKVPTFDRFARWMIEGS